MDLRTVKSMKTSLYKKNSKYIHCIPVYKQNINFKICHQKTCYWITFKIFLYHVADRNILEYRYFCLKAKASIIMKSLEALKAVRGRTKTKCYHTGL